ncbi:hypothetical protein RFN29_16045 [Mesorhizobium sp. VK22B]|uniref:Uncharacterized protein n=1 Tax=Mesorhizobium captivum TaxID=3072319 RepID=A0ABU4Z1Z9_9HYPH|nr:MULTISPECIES: hypothetical protein [unclassified Mesorhizobium]MDX8493083.1 hypothetical protein [Mesorhizobium sp. VK22B]MDX8507671.1 hypothetical protein [Mesorhizobium sp. VK22E]
MTMKFPFVEDTLGKTLQIGLGLSVDCLTCHRYVMLDVPTLARRLGEDYGRLHWDLIKVLYCQQYRRRGALIATWHSRTIRTRPISGDRKVAGAAARDPSAGCSRRRPVLARRRRSPYRRPWRRR